MLYKAALASGQKIAIVDLNRLLEIFSNNAAQKKL